MELYPNILSREDCRGQWREDQIPGELKLFNKIKSAQNLRDWIVLHSVDVRKHVRTTLGELDFLIIMPNKGILGIEVKSHYTVNWDPTKNKSWKLGSEKETNIGPFRQVEDSLRSFRNDYFDKNPVLKNIMCWHLVIFTELNFPVKYEFPEWEFMNRKDFDLDNESFLKKIERTLDTVKSNNLNLNKTDNIDKNQIGILKKIRSEIEICKSPLDRAKERKDNLHKIFDSDQHNFLDTILSNRKMVIQGGAGTGKTLLAIEVARRNCMERKKTLFLCFNTNLGSYLRKQLEPLSDYIEFQTIWKYLSNIIDTYKNIEGAKPELIKKISNLNTSKFEELCECASEVFLSVAQKPEYDCIIIDEAQLVLNQNFIDCLDLLLRDGLQKGNYLLFMDITQSTKGSYLEEIKKLINDYSCTLYPLSINYRNTKEIGLLCDTLCGFSPYKSFINEGSNTQLNKFVPYSSITNQILRLDQTLFEIINNEGYLPDEIVILSAKGQNYDTINFLRDFTNIEFIGFNENIKYYRPNDLYISSLAYDEISKHFKVLNKKAFNGIKLCTIRKFVGLESPVVIIVDLDDLSETMLLYTAITRANYRVYIMHKRH
ncbi:NERD domain-containing protein [Alphaproteobacteria bacterium]|nr:NERD domain-containing protein [Alphaproteobacteria bacterium]